MRCFGRTVRLNRCKNECKFLVCKKHKFQPFIFLFYTIPTVILLYNGIFALINPKEEKEKVDIYTFHDNLSPQTQQQTKTLQQKKISKNSELQKIIDLYEKGDTIKSEKLVEEFFCRKINNYDEYLGYIVASYYETGSYKKAAIKVLERNKTRAKWDHSLKLDFSKCIRAYRLKYSLPQAFDLIDSLKTTDKSQIISYVWPSIPTDIVHIMEKGVHDAFSLDLLDEENIKEIKYFITKYNNDYYIDYGYYVLRDYDKVINKNKSRIYDLCIYAKNYDILKKLYGKYSYDEYFSPYDFITKKKFSKDDIALAKEVIKQFNFYIEQYPKLKHADDACFWIGMLNTNIGLYDEAIKALNNVINYGNGDYITIAERYKILFSQNVSSEFSDKLFKLQKTTTFNRYFYENILYHHYNKFSLAELIDTTITNNRNDLLTLYIELLCEHNNYDKAIKIYETYIDNDSVPILRNKLNKDFTSIIELKNTTKINEAIDIIVDVKNYRKNRILALYLIDYCLNKFENSNKIDYIHYLKIRTLIILNPKIVGEETNKFLVKYPKSQYADDVMCELLSVQVNIFNNLEKGLEIYNRLKANYPNRNAVDNALNFIAEYYYKHSSKYFSNYASNCNKCIEYSEQILQKYPISSYREVSKIRIDKCKDILKY